MSFGQAIKTCFRKYGDFSGRGRRSEFWWFYLFTQLVGLCLGAVYFIVFLGAVVVGVSRADTSESDVAVVLPVLLVYGLILLVSLALFIPSLAASARRLHDMGQSGHWLWLSLIGFGIVPLIMCIMETQPYANQWGPDPKGDERAAWPAPGGYAAYPPPPPQV